MRGGINFIKLNYVLSPTGESYYYLPYYLFFLCPPYSREIRSRGEYITITLGSGGSTSILSPTGELVFVFLPNGDSIIANSPLGEKL